SGPARTPRRIPTLPRSTSCRIPGRWSNSWPMVDCAKMSVNESLRQLTPDGVRFCPLCGGALERRTVGPAGRLEPVCTRCGFVFYLNHKVVAGTIPESDGRILLTRRAINPSYGKWTFPGGFVDWGEPVAAAAVRRDRGG